MNSPSEEELSALQQVVGCLVVTVVLLLLMFAFWAGSVWGEVPECPLTVSDGAASVYLVAIWAHEDPNNLGMRYTVQAQPQTLEPGQVATPTYEGYPIGFEWHHVPPIFPTSKTATIVKSCGDTGRVFPPVFSDGFEGGDTSRWTRSVPLS